MRLAAISLACVALAACSQERAGEQESAGEFANRIGQQDAPADDEQSQPSAAAPYAATQQPPQGADLTQLQQVGDIGEINFGPRDGGCTFMVGGQQMIVAAGMNEPTLPGKAVVRLGDTLVMVDSAPGGLAKIKQGTTFTGEGFTVQVAPAEGDAEDRPATVLVSDAEGNSQTYSGNWNCA